MDTNTRMPGRLCRSWKARPISAGANVPKLFRPIRLRKTQMISAATGKQQQDLHQPPLGRRQAVQRQALEHVAARAICPPAAPLVAATALDQEGEIEVLDAAGRGPAADRRSRRSR